jgi:hypothetical protein
MQLDPIAAAVGRLKLEAPERRAAAQLFRIQAAGERLAGEGARGQARLAPRRSARRFLLRQARQERFHAALFERVAHFLDHKDGCERDGRALERLERIRALLADSLTNGRYADAVIIQHVALEGLGHAVLELLDAELPSSGRRFGRLRRMVLAQEDAHCAFGASVLSSKAHDPRAMGLVRCMLDEAEALLDTIAPQFRALGGDIGDVIEPLRRGMLASTGVVA